MSTNERVLAMVERELKKNPEMKSADLKVKAEKMDPSIGDLNGRQFHARYTIQARKRLPKAGGAKKTRKRRASKKKGGARRTRRTTKAVRATPSGNESDAAKLISSLYLEKKAELVASVENAYSRAVKEDSLKKLNSLLGRLERQASAFDQL